MFKKELAQYLDSTLLKQGLNLYAIEELCKEAREYEFCSVCIPPCYVEMAKKCLEGSPVKVCTVVGFPHGMNTLETKINESINAIQNGADELDIVMNVSYVKSDKFSLLELELTKLVETIKTINHSIITKIIIETSLLTEDEKIKVCEIVMRSGANFIKTSTGFAGGGATLEDVKLIRSVVGDKFLIKASGGIASYSDALAMIKAGANRIGTSKAGLIIKDAD